MEVGDSVQVLNPELVAKTDVKEEDKASTGDDFHGILRTYLELEQHAAPSAINTQILSIQLTTRLIISTYLHTTTGLMKEIAGDMFNPVERLGNAARGGSPSVVRDILEAGQAKVTTYAYHFTSPWN